MTAVAPPVASSRLINRRSHAEDAELARARKIASALPALLPGIAAADADAASVRIDAAWVTRLTKTISQADASSGGRAVTLANVRKATSQERTSASKLGALLVNVRDRVATHAPDDVDAQRAFGRGVKIRPNDTGATAALASTFLAAWDGQWRDAAQAAGVTQATMDQVQSLRDGLTAADTAQQSVITAKSGATVQRAALFSTLRTMSAFAAKVVGSVYGKASPEVASLADPRPLTSRGAARKAATKAKTTAKKAAAKAKKAAAPKDRAATLKRRAKHAAVAVQKAALAAAAKPAPARKGAKKPKKAKKAVRK